MIPCLLGSCGVYTKYERPDSVTVDGLFRDSVASQADTMSIALLFIVPSLFIIFRTIEERVMPKRQLPKIEKE